jgi:hypothetical protein
LREQVDRCKQTISQILASTGQGRDESLRSLALDAYLHRLLDDWQVLRPRARLSVTLHGAQPAPLIAADRTLEQGLLNLLDNAADANGAHPDALAFSATWDAAACRIEILDRGPGISGETAQRLGEAFFSTKVDAREGARGIGIGLFLTNATVERFGGKVELFNRNDPTGRRLYARYPAARPSESLIAMPEKLPSCLTMTDRHCFSSTTMTRFRRVLARALDRRGYAVTVAANSATAIVKAQAQAPSTPSSISRCRGNQAWCWWRN